MKELIIIFIGFLFFINLGSAYNGVYLSRDPDNLYGVNINPFTTEGDGDCTVCNSTGTSSDSPLTNNSKFVIARIGYPTDWNITSVNSYVGIGNVTANDITYDLYSATNGNTTLNFRESATGLYGYALKYNGANNRLYLNQIVADVETSHLFFDRTAGYTHIQRANNYNVLYPALYIRDNTATANYRGVNIGAYGNGVNNYPIVFDGDFDAFISYTWYGTGTGLIEIKNHYQEREFYFDIKDSGKTTTSSTSMGMTKDFNGTSTNTYRGIVFTPKIDQSGSGEVNGIYISPNIIKAANFKAIRMENEQNWSIYQTSANALNYFNGRVGIGTNYPNYPLHVASNVSDISAYFEGSVIALNFSTRTEVYDKSLGSALDQIHDSNYYIKDGKIDHTRFNECFGGYVNVTKQTGFKNEIRENITCTYNWTNKPADEIEASVMPAKDQILKETCKTTYYTEKVPTYATFQEGTVNIGCMGAKYEQAIYELNNKVKALEAAK